MNIDPSTPWFRAKRYGWGWGLPLVWQGWLVIGTNLALSAVGAALLGRHMLPMPAYLACVAILTSILIAVCWLKGEKPRWRWGGKD